LLPSGHVPITEQGIAYIELNKKYSRHVSEYLAAKQKRFGNDHLRVVKVKL
jgi:hypothetical protein